MDKELEGLAEPVRDAVEWMDTDNTANPHWEEVRAELLRLTRECADLRVGLEGSSMLRADAEAELTEMLRECYEWLFESKSDGPRASEGAMEKGYYTAEFGELHGRLRLLLDNAEVE